MTWRIWASQVSNEILSWPFFRFHQVKLRNPHGKLKNNGVHHNLSRFNFLFTFSSHEKKDLSVALHTRKKPNMAQKSKTKKSKPKYFRCKCTTCPGLRCKNKVHVEGASCFIHKHKCSEYPEKKKCKSTKKSKKSRERRSFASTKSDKEAEDRRLMPPPAPRPKKK